MERRHIVDIHAEILFAESRANLNRISNLKQQWSRKAQDGLLPDPDQTGIFQALEAIAGYSPEKINKRLVRTRSLSFDELLKTYFDERILTHRELHQTPLRNYGDVITLTDILREIHELLTIAERSYWQRLEGAEPPATDSCPGGTTSEIGAIQQILNAADFLCFSYWGKATPANKPWTGITIFGQYHEFRRQGNFICIPNYAKLRNLEMWIYLSHEVSHQIVEELRGNNEFESILNDLMGIFNNTELLKYHTESLEYIAIEVLADIFATLIAGEGYIKTLSEFKYYPSLVIFETPYFIARQILVPSFLRTLVCCWVVLMAWGLDDPRSSVVLKDIIDKVMDEDAMVVEHIMSLSRMPEEEMKERVLERGTIPGMRIALEEVAKYLEELNVECCYAVEGILEKRIVQRTKNFVLEDFYKTLPHEYCYEIEKKKLDQDLASNLKGVKTTCCIPSSDKSIVAEKVRRRKGALQKIWNRINDFQVVSTDPRDVVACLAMSSSRNNRSNIDHIAILSMCCYQRARDARFQLLTPICPVGSEEKKKRGSI